ncbi:MAG: hypothetical protein JST22_10305 [Bacteroidetes bacterium]|nr:hypothetical protein [Bacteroidota bacterium]
MGNKPPVRFEGVERGENLVSRLMEKSMTELDTSMRARYPDMLNLHTYWFESRRWKSMVLGIVRVDRPDEEYGTFTDEERTTLDMIGHHMMNCIRVYMELTRVHRLSFDFFAERCRTVATTHGLTTSELKVLRLMVDGVSNNAISEELGIALATVKTHVSHILQKTGCRNRSDVIGQHFSLRNLYSPR